MSDEPNSVSTGNPPMPPPVMNGQELYDRIMGQIEPDLLSTSVDTLTEKYAQESPEERAVRSQRYRAALTAYEAQLATYQQQWDEQLRTYKRQAIAYIEHQTQTNESPQLEDIESSFSADA